MPMFGNPAGSGLSFTKVLSGISKTLNIANQVIPLYREAKPMINNAKTILGVLKDFNTPKTSNTTSNTKSVSEDKIKKEPIREYPTTNSPRFFL